MLLSGRKQVILAYVVEEYIVRAEPVGSKLLSERSALDVSPATLRNEMRELEEVGLLTHAHTSSGRMPTASGYAYYVEHLMKPEVLDVSVVQGIQEIVGTGDSDTRIKQFARLVSESCNTAVIVSSGRDSFYYTGISSFFSQPEFKDYSFTLQISGVFDACEDRMPEVSEKCVNNDAHVFIGTENPLSEQCGLVATRLKDEVIFGILGPLRMRYDRAVAFVSHARDII